MTTHYTDYTWIVGLGAVLSFITAYGIGANDVANAFGSSVGSRAITIKQALLIASVCEFSGAMGLGAQVTTTIRVGIAKFSVFADAPDLFMFGMLCTLAATGVWLILATAFELPVSTTHSCVGGVLGFAIAARGQQAVVWYGKAQPGQFPVGGVAGIVISWVFSPVCSGVLASLLFYTARTVVLRSRHSYARSWQTLPCWVFLTVSLNVLFMVLSGAKSRTSSMSNSQAIGVSLATGAATALVIALLIRSVLKPKAEELFQSRIRSGEIVPDPDNPNRYLYDQMRIRETEIQKKNEFDAKGDRNAAKSLFQTLTTGLRQDVHDVVDTDVAVSTIHGSAEVFDARTEEAFKYLQVFTAMSNSFAHGANDVANSVGPMAGIWYVWKTQKLSKKTDASTANDMYWILALGGAGIIVGLSTYGYMIMRALGVKIAKLTPSRGFAVELGAAFIIVIGSRLGLPLSTTHCMVGSTIGIGLLEDHRGVNWGFIPRIVFGWVITLVFVGCTCAMFYAMGAYAPSVYGIRDRDFYQNVIEGFTTSLYRYVNVTDSAQLVASSQYNNWTATLGRVNDQAELLYQTRHASSGARVIGRTEVGHVLDDTLSFLIGSDGRSGMLSQCAKWT